MENIPSKTKPRGDIKIIIVGNSGTGKTSFCNVWTKKEFKESMKPTIMTEFNHQIYKYKDSLYKVQLWDIGGQDKNIHATRVLTKDALGCLIMCDCKDQKSLNESLKWKQAIESSAKFKDGSNLPIFLLQNKIDLLTEEELKDESAIKAFALNNNFTSYMRTSAKMKIGIDETMDAFLGVIIDKVIKYEKDTNTPVFSSERKSIALENPKQKMTMQRLDESQGCC